MSYKAKTVDTSISGVLNEYIQSGSAKIIKESKTDRSCVVVIKGDELNLKTLEIRKKLRDVGYITSITIPRRTSVLGAQRKSAKSSIGNRHALRSYKRNRSIVCLKVAAPNPPVSPPSFPDPNGKQPKKSKKKKG